MNWKSNEFFYRFEWKQSEDFHFEVGYPFFHLILLEKTTYLFDRIVFYSK